MTARWMACGTAVLILAAANAQPPMPANVLPDPPRDSTNLFCAEKVQLPEYTELAKMVRLEGTLIATVKLGPDARMSDLTVQSQLNNDQARLLSVSVEYSLRKSQFKRECAGREVTLVFEFHITGDPWDRQQKEFAFGYPNKFIITSRPTQLPTSVDPPGKIKK